VPAAAPASTARVKQSSKIERSRAENLMDAIMQSIHNEYSVAHDSTPYFLENQFIIDEWIIFNFKFHGTAQTIRHVYLDFFRTLHGTYRSL